ncbi:hypothetical protein Pcac1_g13737 [Phytophthora cactorum]|nr:hypothetical protein Pcac1_g13737 [Phytophthora cactorum]
MISASMSPTGTQHYSQDIRESYYQVEGTAQPKDD